MSSLVVYYSKTGNTRLLAEAYAKALGADLFALEEEKPRGEGANYAGAGFQAVFKVATHLRALPDLTKYDAVYVGTPTWASSCVPAVNRFFKEADLKGKTVYGFSTQLGPTTKAGEQMEQAARKRGAAFGGFHSLIMPQKGSPDPQMIEQAVKGWL